MSREAGPRLYAVSDLHVAYGDNHGIVRELRSTDRRDWLVVAGDVAEKAADVEWALRLLAERFATVVWVPGNHELWTHPDDPVRLRGEARYRHLVELCRSIGVLTPEDPYPVWPGPDGPVTVAPLFLLYDYSFLPPGVTGAKEALAEAEEAGVMCTDEILLHPDPHPDRAQWCRSRIAYTRERLDACDPELPTVLVNHFPLVREPTRILRHPEFALWCGTTATADWHRRYRAATVVYGHLHIPRTTWHDGVPHREVSLGYPREWRARGLPDPLLREILPRRSAR
ncbi:metallophosphoesterase family protein [Wenjunlia tyrosinilytica]|uniref:metallophosphoesterase family protein n=1 Tax=Wenjunlia tyrosinilytica TaxID=1544741 RepID=UPI001E2F491A|nr:metallophosphoesterase [Wenjunlia tyrosinilytica]